jgi:hypothetical protein
MFTEEEVKFFVEAACGKWIAGCKVEEGVEGIAIVTEPNGTIHEVRPVCGVCGDATGTCEHA